MPESVAKGIPEIIELNGNHWRKIFSIYAKITCGEIDWRKYRDSHLLGNNESISFSDHLAPGDCFHLVAGKVNWQQICCVGTDPQQQGFKPIDDEARLWQKGKVILCPYLDYRQFPNKLVALLIQFLAEDR